MHSQMLLSSRFLQKGVSTALFVALCAAFAAAGCGDAGNDVPSDASPAAQAQGPEPGTACGGMTPLEAARFYKEEAREAGGSKRFLELVTEPTPAVESSPGYPKLVGAFYASTLPPAKRAAAAASCAEELAAK